MLIANTCTFFIVKFLASNSLGSFCLYANKHQNSLCEKDLHCLQSSWSIFLYDHGVLFTHKSLKVLFFLILIISYFLITHSGSFFCSVAMASSLCFIPGVLTRWSFVSFLKKKIKIKTFVGSWCLVGGLLRLTLFFQRLCEIYLIGDCYDGNFTILDTETMVYQGAKLPFRQQTVA